MRYVVVDQPRKHYENARDNADDDNYKPRNRQTAGPNYLGTARAVLRVLTSDGYRLLLNASKAAAKPLVGTSTCSACPI